MKKYIINFVLILLTYLSFSCEKLLGDVEDLNSNVFDEEYVGDHVVYDSIVLDNSQPTTPYFDIYFHLTDSLETTTLPLECYMANFEHDFTAQVHQGVLKLRLYHSYVLPSGSIQNFEFYARGTDAQRGGLIGNIDVKYEY